MTRLGLLLPGAAQELQDARHRRAAPAYEDSAAAGGAAAFDAGDPGGAERARLRRKAGVHGHVASWICGLMQATPPAAMICGSWQPCGFPAPPSAAGAAVAVEREVQALERIIAWQARTAGWHLGEARRLRDLAGWAKGAGRPCRRAGTGPDNQR
jgi:hypothetical protein